MQTLYIALKEQITLTGLQPVRVRDIAEIDGDAAVVKRVQDLIITKITEPQPHSFQLDILDFTRTLRRFCPGVEVNSVGASEALIHFRPEKPAPHPFFQACKILFIALILFFGAVISLMSFQNEASLPMIFSNIHRLFTGETTDRPVALLISYTVGIAVGITVFFNHWAGVKIQEDPTPVEVEYASYNKEIHSCMLDVLKKQDAFSQDSKGGP